MENKDLYRKRPVVIEAYQITEDNVDSLAEWCDGQVVDFAGEPRIQIATLEGPLYGPPGWWIIKGVKGEFYPCDPEVFEQTYDKVDDDE